MKSKLFKSEEKVVIDKITTNNQETVLAKEVSKNTALEDLHHVILKREYNLMKEMRHPNIVEFLDYDDLNSRIHFKNADIETLESLLNYSELTIVEICQMAIQVMKALDFLWDKGIIYNNLNPRSILFNKDDKLYKLVNFHNSSNIARHQENESKLSRIDGDIHFISPEQSGRMNRSIDYRSDIYSLGAVLYSALSGKKLFPEKTIHEVIHAHIAKEPIPIEVHNPKVITALSEVIHKMLSKNAEERYQSSFGVKKDLEDVIAIIQGKKLPEGFKLGKHDKDSSFEIPEKLYGRELEKKNVLYSYEDTVGKRNRLLLVNGYSGIGKTALINEVKKPITKHNGQFTFGKFDQLKKSIPFSGFIQALSNLVNDILTEDEHTIFEWRERILNEVGSDSHIITDLIPQLEKIIGKQKRRLEDLTSVEMQNLFNKTLRDFIGVFKTNESPLVLFLDDLQWADNSTINLIKFLVTDPKNNNLLLIAGYRSNEVGVNHPFQICIEETKALGGQVDEISLENLTPKDILELLIDTLKYEYNEETALDIKDLTNTIYKKTKGNPFFTKNLIKSLYTKGLIYYNEAARQWSWMQEKIEQTQISNNLLDLLISNLKQKNEDELKLIKFASIIGASFDTKILTQILDMNTSQFESALYRCIEDDLIIPLDKNYRYIGTVQDGSIVCRIKFSHDKIQQAAYELCSEDEKINAHEKISNYFKDQYKSSENADIFELSFHLNKLIGKRDIDPSFVSEINYKAGLKAQEASAYFAAKDHYEISYKFLPEDAWDKFYDFTLSVATALSECYYLCAETEKAEELYNYLLTKTKNKDDKAKIYEIQMNYFTNQGRADDAIKVGRKALKLYGINFPERANMAQVFPKLLRVKLMFFFKKDQDILNNKKLTNTDALAAMKILSNMSPSCFIQSPASMLLNCLNCLILTLKHGNTDVSSYVISLMGFVEAVALSNYDRAHELMKLATAIGDKFDPEQKYKSKLIFSWNNFVQFYHAPIIDSTKWLRKGHAAGINCGDFNFANYCLYSLFSRELFLGNNLSDVYKNAIEYSQFADSISDQYIIPMMQIMRRFISLMNNEYDPNFIERDQKFNSPEFIKHQEDNEDSQNLAWLYTFDSIRHYIHEEFESAYQSSLNAEVHGEVGAQKQIILFEHYFYSVLIAAKEIKKGKATRPRALKHAQINLKKIEKASKTMPQNFRARFHLAKAAYIEATQPNSQELIYFHYHKAIDFANIDRFIHIEAIACENFALYLEQFDSHGYCRFLNKKAYECYKKWGALNKLRLLQHRMADSAETQEMDIETKTFVETAHHISSERDLESLILKIIDTGIQYSNAQTGILVTKEKGGLVVHGKKENFPKVLIDFVLNTGDVIRLDTLEQQERFVRDNYFKEHTPQSVIALPLTSSEQTNAVLYLENETTKGVFTEDKTEVLEVITTQMALALENAIILRDLEKIVGQRTQELEKKRSELELSYKEKETLIRVLCHDLANIVMANKAALRRVTRELGPEVNESIDSYIQRLSLSLKSEAYIINNVRSMELAKKNNLMLKFERINLIEALVNSIDTFEEQALSKNVKIKVDDRIKNAQVYCDKISLSVNVLNNIINNAIKFSFDKGNIDVNFLKEDSEYFQFEIRDYGVGMTKEFRDNLFKNTYHESTKGTSQERGSGFGLGIIKFYIDKFNGELDIESIHKDESESNHGTSIRITLRKGPIENDS